mmetsp:Transcript_95940/g.311139  ORF Transcript_95940/g.311139 Transcript_95940/m.311139 type:complete len:300 (+) Transcript_95940:1827-2726(+)
MALPKPSDAACTRATPAFEKKPTPPFRSAHVRPRAMSWLQAQKRIGPSARATAPRVLATVERQPLSVEPAFIHTDAGLYQSRNGSRAAERVSKSARILLPDSNVLPEMVRSFRNLLPFSLSCKSMNSWGSVTFRQRVVKLFHSHGKKRNCKTNNRTIFRQRSASRPTLSATPMTDRARRPTSSSAAARAPPLPAPSGARASPRKVFGLGVKIAGAAKQGRHENSPASDSSTEAIESASREREIRPAVPATRATCHKCRAIQWRLHRKPAHAPGHFTLRMVACCGQRPQPLRGGPEGGAN